jgi:hypothetical protein
MNDSAGDAARPSAVQTGAAPSAGQNIPVFRDIRVTNLKATSLKSAGMIQGLPENCISNVVFENVQISSPEGLSIRNAKGIGFINSNILAADGAPVISDNAQIDGLETSTQK